MAAPPKSLDEFFHSLMPHQLRETLDPQGAAYIRARALSSILVIISVFGVMVCLAVAALHLLLAQPLFNYAIALVAITAAILAQAALFYRNNNYWASGLAFTIFYFLIGTVMLILSGGYDSPGVVFLLTCPMIAFLVGGWQEGVQCAVLTIFIAIALAVLKFIGFDLPNIFYQEHLHIMFAVNWIITLMVLVACFIIYESGLEHNHHAPDDYRQDARTRLQQFDSPVDASLHRLIPMELREHLDIRSHLYARVKIITVMLCAATALSGLSMCVLLVGHILFQPEHLKYDVVIVIITALFALQTWAFYKYRNYELSGMLLGYYCFLIVLVLVVLSGGYDTPTIVLLMICPVVFFIVGGVREGILNALFVAVVGVAFAWMKANGIELPSLFQDVSPPVVFAITWSIAVIGIALCLMAYDSELQRRE